MVDMQLEALAPLYLHDNVSVHCQPDKIWLRSAQILLLCTKVAKTLWAK